MIKGVEMHAVIIPLNTFFTMVVLDLERHDNVPEIFFFSIETISLDKNRREAGLKSDSDIFAFDDLKSIDKIGRIEADLIVPLDLCGDFCFTSTEFCITRVEPDNTGSIESHFDVEIILTSDEADLTESLDELGPIRESIDTGCFWKEIPIVRKVTIEKSRIEEYIFVDEQYLIISEIQVNTDAIRKSLHDFTGTSSRENDGYFFINSGITIVAVF